MTHLLPCTSCQQSIPVETSQAGGVVSCECGAEIAVPTLREIRRLPKGEEPQAASAAGGKAAWSSAQGSLFALGFVIAALAAGSAGYYYLAASRIETSALSSEDKLVGEQVIDSLTAGQAYEAWKMLRIEGIGDQQKPEYVEQEEKKIRYQARSRIALVVLVVGFLTMGLGMFIARPRTSSASSTPPLR
jgi:hypothetical protein